MAKRNKTAADASATGAEALVPLQLPAELTIFAVAELREPWQAWLSGLSGAAQATVRADAVDQVDAAGLQLLLSLQRSAKARGHSLQLLQPSHALRSGCQALGLEGWLHSHAAEEEVAS
jgi:ABC-type transporter Mla MlaB component